MTQTPPHEEPIDGRTARAVRTKEAIVEACLGLIDEGDLRPTGPRIAERAGVSVRSIFQHFDDLDGLFSAVGERVTVRIGGLIGAIDSSSPLNERIDAFAIQRAAVLEALTPVLRAALVYAASSKVIRTRFEEGHHFLRAQVAEVFAPELAEAPDSEVARQSLVVALSWPTWNLLRDAQQQNQGQARTVVASMVRAILAPPSADV